jgi:hypothetical protein
MSSRSELWVGRRHVIGDPFGDIGDTNYKNRGDTLLSKEVVPWRGVTVGEQRQRYLEDYQLDYYSVTARCRVFGSDIRHLWLTEHLI